MGYIQSCTTRPDLVWIACTLPGLAAVLVLVNYRDNLVKGSTENNIKRCDVKFNITEVWETIPELQLKCNITTSMDRDAEI